MDVFIVWRGVNIFIMGAYRQANRLFADASKSLGKKDLMTLEAEDILASRVFLEGKLDMDGDEGSDEIED